MYISRQERKVIDELTGDIVIYGEVGIGNTTTSSTLITVLAGVNVELLCGTGASTTRDRIDDDVVAKKISIVKEAMIMNYHKASSLLGKPLKALEAVGGAEICAMVGGMLESSQRNLPILVDGFISTCAAMIASMFDASVTRALLFATVSTERGQAIALNVIKDIALSNNFPAPTEPALKMNL